MVDVQKMTVPRRRWRLELDIEGDGLDDIRGVLDHLIYEVSTDQLPAERVSGSPSTGYILRLTENVGQTPERFIEENTAYLMALHDQGQEGGGCE